MNLAGQQLLKSGGSWCSRRACSHTAAPATPAAAATTTTTLVSSKVSRRPELDFNYLLDPVNLASIEANIGQRKHVGNIIACTASGQRSRAS